MKIYTRKGDRGRTKLFGGDEVAKGDTRVEAYGTLDELNAALGVALSLDPDDTLGMGGLAAVQEDLLVIGSRLAAARPDRAMARGAIPVLPDGRVAELEAWIDSLDAELPSLDAFVVPGGSPAGAHLHLARTVCRRAERIMSTLLDEQPDLSQRILPYINRLSDVLFTLARYANRRAGKTEAPWLPVRRRGASSANSDREEV
jgi:cob(I)alamin adenosyltransferase